MDGWASYLSLLSFTSSLGDLFAEAPLLSAASSLSSYLSWLLLLCATQVFSLHSCYSAFSSLQRVALWSRTTFHPAVSMRLATSSCNPACQEHCSITHALLHAAVPLRFVTAGCKPAQQERHTKSTNVRAALTMGMIIELALQSHTHFADLIFQKCPETARFFLLSLQSCALFVDNFFRYRDPTSATRGSTLPKKNRVSCPRVVSPVNSHASKLLRFPTT